MFTPIGTMDPAESCRTDLENAILKVARQIAPAEHDLRFNAAAWLDRVLEGVAALGGKPGAAADPWGTRVAEELGVEKLRAPGFVRAWRNLAYRGERKGNLVVNPTCERCRLLTDLANVHFNRKCA